MYRLICFAFILSFLGCSYTPVKPDNAIYVKSKQMYMAMKLERNKCISMTWDKDGCFLYSTSIKDSSMCEVAKRIGYFVVDEKTKIKWPLFNKRCSVPVQTKERPESVPKTAIYDPETFMYYMYRFEDKKCYDITWDKNGRLIAKKIEKRKRECLTFSATRDKLQEQYYKNDDTDK